MIPCAMIQQFDGWGRRRWWSVCVVCVCAGKEGVYASEKKPVNAEIIKGNVWYSQERLEHQ